MISFTEKNVNVGLNPRLDVNQRHGIAWIRDKNGHTKSHSFIVDNPQHLLKPNGATVGRLFKQLKKVGLVAISIELHVGGKTRVYKAGHLRPLLVQSRPDYAKSPNGLLV